MCAVCHCSTHHSLFPFLSSSLLSALCSLHTVSLSLFSDNQRNMASSSLPPATKATTNFPLTHSFRLSPKPNNLRFPPTKPGNSLSFTRFKAQLNEVALDSSSNATPIKAKSDEEQPSKPSAEPSSVLATQESVSQFITQVASLVKLVDSRDIVELKMKQYDIELTIRKKEAMPELQPAPQPTVVYSPLPPMMSPPPVAPTSSPTTSVAHPTATPTSPPALKSTKSSVPPLKSPMAGTFYRSPGPGEPAFVEVGDKVKKGQVVCIIEAMKLMNEIEAEESGTIVEILAEDAKPVSLDTPLFVIEP